MIREESIFLWDDVKAMTAVEMGMSIRRAGESHGVPQSTLHDGVSGESCREISTFNCKIVFLSTRPKPRTACHLFYRIKTWAGV